MAAQNQVVEKHLTTLAQLCCDSLAGEGEPLIDRAEPLLKSLLLSGFGRSSGPPLQVELEKRIVAQCSQAAMNRHAVVSGLTGKLQKQFDEMVRWESKSPAEDNPPQAANLSTADKRGSRRRRTSD
jgi:hypothetical protein